MRHTQAAWVVWERELLELTQIPVLVFTPELNRIVTVNQAAANLFGVTRAELTAMSAFDLSRPGDFEEVRAAGLAFNSGNVASHEADKVFVRADGSQFRARLNMTRIPHPILDAAVLVRIETAQLNSDGHGGTAALSQNAWRDAYDDAIHKFRQAEESQVATVAAVGIRSVERSMERLGWTSGRALSSAVLRRLNEALSETDLVVELYGGTTAILLHGVTDRRAAELVVGRLVAMFDHPVFVAGESEQVEVQAGAVCVDGSRVGGDAALTMAVAALNAARATGASVSVFDPETARKRRGEKMLEQKICSGIEAGMIRGAVQPIIDLQSGLMCGVEALARLELAPVGPISPEIFIPLASERGLMPRVTEQVMADGLSAIRRLGPDGADLKLSLNVSGEQLTKKFPDWLEAHLPVGTRPEQIQIEVTESVLIEQGQSVGVLHQLAEVGYRIAIDDFGTGYSSLTYLIEWPAHIVKLDKSFVGPIDTGDQRSMSIVRSVIDLAREMDLITVAEGVERPAQLDLLREWGCDRVQGYLISRPVWPDQLEAIFRQIQGDALSCNGSSGSYLEELTMKTAKT